MYVETKHIIIVTGSGGLKTILAVLRGSISGPIYMIPNIISVSISNSSLYYG